MPKPITVNWETVKTLVTAFGPREAARRTGINPNTLMSRCIRHGWRKAVVAVETSQPLGNQSPSDALAEVLQTAKTQSTLHLARFTEKASKQAANSGKPLEIARKVRDVAAVYGQLWPNEKRTEIIQASILLNPDLVTDEEDIRESGGVVKRLNKVQKHSK